MEKPEISKLSNVDGESGIISSSTVPVTEEQVISTPMPLPFNHGQPLNESGRRIKRYIHCSDGVYEEYSSDEEGVYQVPNNQSLVDPKSMPWMPWIAHVSSKALAACDYVGETLADFLGITAPKYQYEIEEAKRMSEEAKAEKEAIDLEMAGWSTSQQLADQSQIQEPQINSPVSILPKILPVHSNGTH